MSRLQQHEHDAACRGKKQMPGCVLTLHRAELAQAAADGAALLAPPSPPPEPATSPGRSPVRSRRGPSAAKAAKKAPQKPQGPAASPSPRRRSKTVVAATAATAAAEQPNQMLAQQDSAQAAVASQADAPAPAPAAAGEDATASDGIPAELSAAVSAWQQFEQQAKGLLVGRTQPDSAMQLLQSFVEGKKPEQVTLEVSFMFKSHSKLNLLIQVGQLAYRLIQAVNR